MVQDICEFLPVILNECSGITSQSSYTKRRVSTLSHADAESLPSYGVVLHGGEALHPVLQHRHTMSLAIHALDLLVVAAPEFRAVSLNLCSYLDGRHNKLIIHLRTWVHLQYTEPLKYCIWPPYTFIQKFITSFTLTRFSYFERLCKHQRFIFSTA